MTADPTNPAPPVEELRELISNLAVWQAEMERSARELKAADPSLAGAAQGSADVARVMGRAAAALSSLTVENERLRATLEGEHMTVTLSRDGVVTSHSAFDADFDEMVLATEAIVRALQARLSDRKFCPYSHGGSLRHGSRQASSLPAMKGDEP